MATGRPNYRISSALMEVKTNFRDKLHSRGMAAFLVSQSSTDNILFGCTIATGSAANIIFEGHRRLIPDYIVVVKMRGANQVKSSCDKSIVTPSVALQV